MIREIVVLALELVKISGGKVTLPNLASAVGLIVAGMVAYEYFVGDASVLLRAASGGSPTELQASLGRDMAAKGELERLRAAVGGARATVWRYHDSQPLMGQGHAYFMSATVEADGPGFSPMLTSWQRIPITLIEGTADILGGRCISARTDATPAYRAIAGGTGAVLITKCPLHDLARNVVGQVAVSFYHDPTHDQQLAAEALTMRAAAAITGHLFQ